MSVGISILGSTGSIGLNTLRVIENLGGGYHVCGLTVNTSVAELRQQCEKWRPEAVAVFDESSYKDFLTLSNGMPSQVSRGLEGLERIASLPEANIVINGLVGSVGLSPTLAALKAGKRVGLANKESLVMGGELVTEVAEKHGGKIIAVDSEHSAILQAIGNEPKDSIRRIILTASGGPFRGRSAVDLKDITVEAALNHPTWKMGPKITIDSATLTNKGLEVIEAHFLFGIDYDKIDVVIHPQSIIHSMVEFIDGSVLAQMGLPDMKVPIQYAITYPKRMPSDFIHCDFKKFASLTFEEVDKELFPALGLAYRAGRMGGTAPAVFNAANEVAVDKFLKRRISFQSIYHIVYETLHDHTVTEKPDLNDIINADCWARETAAMNCGK